MGSSLAKEIEALQTTEQVIAALVLSPERDEVIDRLIAAIEQDRPRSSLRWSAATRSTASPATCEELDVSFSSPGRHAVSPTNGLSSTEKNAN